MNRLRQLREEKNLKQEDIAKLLHVEIAAVSKYETNRVPLKDEYIIILSEFFNVSADYLLGRVTNDLDSNTDFHVGLSKADESSLTDEEKEEIRDFAKFVMSKRK